MDLLELNEIKNAAGTSAVGRISETEIETVAAAAGRRPCIFNVSEPCNIDRQALTMCGKCPIGYTYLARTVFAKIIGLASNMFTAEINLRDMLSTFLKRN